MKAFYALFAPFALLVLALANGPQAQAQARGGMPGGIPGGPPFGSPPMGPPVGIPGGPGNMPEIGGGAVGPGGIGRGGPPMTLPEVAAERARIAAVPGLERAQAAKDAPLADAEKERAATLASQSPDVYELDANGALAVKGEVLVAGLDAPALARIETAGFRVLRKEEMPDLGLVLAAVSTGGLSAREAIAKLRRIAPGGTYELNHVMFESGGTGAGSRKSATLAEAEASAGPAIVGLIDTGVSTAIDARPQLQIVRRNFAPGPATPREHGTAVASLLARAPGPLQIYAADIFGPGGVGGTSELLVRSLNWMAERRVPVINISMVGPGNQIVGAVIENLIAHGFVIVAPVGNDGRAARPLFPASYAGVIAVSAAGADGRLLPEASRVKRVDFVAPGIATVADTAGRTVTVRGTSFAAPLVARMIADRLRAPAPAAARSAVRLLARQAVRPRDDREWYGRGLVGMARPGGSNRQSAHD